MEYIGSIKDKEEWQNSGTNVVHKALYSCLNGIALRYGRRRKSGQTHRRRIVCQNAKVEDKHVHRDEGDNDAIG